MYNRAIVYSRVIPSYLEQLLSLVLDITWLCTLAFLSSWYLLIKKIVVSISFPSSSPFFKRKMEMDFQRQMAGHAHNQLKELRDCLSTHVHLGHLRNSTENLAICTQ